MIRISLLLIFCIWTLGLTAQKTRVLISTDLGQDPDDQQSMIRLLHYTDLLEIEGIILNADSNNNYEAPKLDIVLMDTLLAAYQQAYKSFKRFGDFMEPHILKSKVKKGSTLNSIHKAAKEYIGDGFDTEGSDWIITKIDESTAENPLNICLWGGGVDLAQALWKVKETRSEMELDLFVSKIRVYSISKQDTSVDWILTNFPKLLFILSDNPESSWKASFRGMFLGGDLENTSKAYFDQNITNENALTKLYPTKTYTGPNPHGYMKEGDSPSFLFFLKIGLNNDFDPNFGSWGGRFQTKNNYLWTEAKDSLNQSSNNSINTVSRWRKVFQADFAMRAKWGNPNRIDVNLPPIIKASVHKVKVAEGIKYTFDSSESFDPNNEVLQFHWWVYKEPSSYQGSVIIDSPHEAKTSFIIPNSHLGKSLHLILEVKDTKGVTRYRRFIIEAEK